MTAQEPASPGSSNNVSMLTFEELSVGDRVQSRDDSRATVRFLGAVTGATPEDCWVGIEWDEEGRGKHDGSAKGKRYFECPQGHGSFVRADTVLKAPRTFQDAFVFKYASEDAASAEEKMMMRTAKGKKTQVLCELVGNEREVKRMLRTAELDEITLPAALIARAGDVAWLREHACGIASLELEDNLFRRWEDLAELAAQLPRLAKLSLSGNRLEPPPAVPPAPLLAPAFSVLSKLALNATGVTFAHLDALKTFLPRLTDLHVASNGMAALQGAGGGALSLHGWPALEALDLSDNRFEDWAALLPLAGFTALRRLIVNGNRIAALHFPPAADGAGAPAFAALELLAAANNRIGGWESVRALAALPCLAELRLQGNPIGEGRGPSAVRQLLVAHLPALRSVNGGEVRARERVEAEKFYIRDTLARAAPAPPEEALAADALLRRLVDVHGLPPVSAVATGTGGAKMLSVALKSMAPESSHKPAVVRKLPGSMTVAHVKRMMQQLFKLDVARQHLLAKGAEQGDVWDAVPMEDDLRQIAHYITDDDNVEIIMQEIDDAVRSREADDAARRQREAEEAQARGHAGMESAMAEEVAGAKAAAAAAAAATAAAAAAAAVR